MNVNALKQVVSFVVVGIVICVNVDWYMSLFIHMTKYEAARLDNLVFEATRLKRERGI